MSGNELFVKKGSKKIDAPLHDPILDSAEAEKMLRSVRAARLAKQGLTAQQIVDAYG